MDAMRATVLHIDDCPNWVQAGERFEAALRAEGRGDVTVEYRLLSTTAEAAQTAFAGSPTLVLDDEDLFPSAGRTAELACRIYRTPSGLAGIPTTAQIVDAIDRRRQQ